MRRALVLLSLFGAIVGEAPYHLPRPAAYAPALHYPAAPAPPPPLQHLHPHPPPPPVLPAPPPAPHFPPQQVNTPNFGYNYPVPYPNYIQPAPQPAPQPFPQPAPAPAPAPAPQYQYPAPAPPPQPIARPIVYPQPSSVYGTPQIDVRIAPAPQQSTSILNPTYVSPQPAPQPQLAPQPQPAPQPQLAPQPQPLPQLAPIPYQQPVQYYQQQQLGYNYQQPIAPTQSFHSQPLSSGQESNFFSSYQADSNQYRGSSEQVHRDALDSLVVNRVQNIIKDDEHSVARNAGYQSLVSGVSLESAKPSVEILSFTHTSGSSASASQSPSIANSAVSISSPSTSYGQPFLGDQSESSGSISSSLNFLPQSQPAIAYGPTN